VIVVNLCLALVMSYSLIAIVLPGLKSGVLQARGRTYSRKSETKRFWMGIAFWLIITFFSWAMLFMITFVVFMRG
jgi:hypothetical protein